MSTVDPATQHDAGAGRHLVLATRCDCLAVHAAWHVAFMASLDQPNSEGSP